MSKLILVSFADNRYRNSLKRLENQTRDFPFDERYFLTEKNSLTKEYWRKLKPWLYRRGYGFWAWKSSILKEYLNKLDEGDMLFWSDAGLMWNSTPTSLQKFDEYVKKLSGDNDILVFNQPTVEQEWTKGDVLEALGVYNNEDICNSLQFLGGLFLIKKTARTLELIDKLIELCDLSKELITDKRSSVPNKVGFKEHRHDQSLFSVLVKTYPHVAIPWQETQVEDGDWSKLADHPIQARRLKEQDRPKSEVIKNKLMRPWRDFLGFYFTKIRHYEYSCDHYPW